VKGNKAFHDSQRAVDAASNAKAEKIIAESPVAAAYFKAIDELRRKFREQ
jgi:hypothetical protein